MTVSLFRSDPWNLQPGTQESRILAAFPEGDQEAGMVGSLYPLSGSCSLWASGPVSVLL